MQSAHRLLALAVVSEGQPDISARADGSGIPKRKRRRARGIRRAMLLLLALVVILHRPLLIAVVHAVAIKVAARQNIELSLEIEGSILTNISLKNIVATPNGKGPTPVDKISIEEVTVQYSIPTLLRKGVSEFLRSYTLRNATISVKPVGGTEEQKSDLASTLHGLIQQPALFSNRVEIDNLNLIAHVPDGEFAVKGFSLTLDPVQPGALGIALLQVPKVRTWHDLKATSSYANRDLILRDLEIDPQIVVQKFELDASQRAQGVNRLDVQGTIFGGNAQFSLLVRELPGKHQNNVSNAFAQIDSSVSDLSLEQVPQYFNTGTPVIGSVSDASVHLTGDPNSPSSWSGWITTDIGAVQAGGAVLDKAGLRLDATKGWATFGSTVFSGSNSVTVCANGELPESIEGFAGMAVTGLLNISGNDLHRFAGIVSSGTVAGDGTFDLHNNTLRAALDLKASNVTTSGMEVSSGKIKAEVTKLLAPPNESGTGSDATPFDGLQTQLDAHLSNLRAAGYAVDSADLDVTTQDGMVRIEKVSVRRADGALSASGTYTMPRDMKSWATAPGAVVFSLEAPSIAAFNAESNPNGLTGKLEATGSLMKGPDGYAGDITANASELRVHDFGAEGLKLNVSMAKSVATINTLTLTLNPTDGFSATGRVNLQSPYHYDGAVQAQIRDLSKFNKLMAGVKGGLGGGLAGALNLAWRGKGDAASLQSTGELQLALEHGRIRDIKGIHAALDGSYSPEQLNFPTINITSSMGNFSAVIGARDNLLRIDQIAFQQGGHPLLSGSLAIPLDLRTPAKLETLIPSNGPIWANLVSNDIAFDSLFPKGQAPATGTARFSIAARGSIAQPDVRVTLIGRGLKAKAAATLAPIALNADITLQRSQLSLQTRIAPAAGGAPLLTGSVSLPVNLRTPTKPETLIPTNEPISANLATGDLELASFFPAGKAPATGIGKISITEAAASISRT